MLLYAKETYFGITEPSKSINDIKLPEDTYKADFELSKRYQEFVENVIKFSLLGIAGYGFLIEKVVGTAHIAVMATGVTFALVITGLLSLVCSAGLGLYCGQLNKACLHMQVSILRLLQRRDSERWTNPALSSTQDVQQWKKANEYDLAALRKGQGQNLARAHKTQRITVWVLILGLVATASVFIRCLYLDASMRS